MNELNSQFSCHAQAGALQSWTTGLITLSPRLCQILKSLEAISGTDVEVLRAVRRHTVLRARGLLPNQRTLIIKGFPLGRLKSRLQYRKYGWAEITNWQRARQHAIPAPDYFGYFEWRPFGLVKANGVFMEDLHSYRSLDQLSRAPGADRLAILRRAIPLLRQLYEEGVNHADPSPHNMMLAPDSTNLRMIDWEGCAFVGSRQPTQLLLHAAHFLNFAELTSANPEWKPWLDELHAACAMPIKPAVMHRAVAGLQPRGRIPLPERLNLVLDDATRATLQEQDS